MVGFQRETEAAFRASCDLLLNSPVSYAHVFSYSQRGGTAEARLPKNTPPAQKKQYSIVLQEISEKKKESFVAASLAYATEFDRTAESREEVQGLYR